MLRLRDVRQHISKKANAQKKAVIDSLFNEFIDIVSYFRMN